MRVCSGDVHAPARERARECADEGEVALTGGGRRRGGHALAADVQEQPVSDQVPVAAQTTGKREGRTRPAVASCPRTASCESRIASRGQSAAQAALAPGQRCTQRARVPANARCPVVCPGPRRRGRRRPVPARRRRDPCAVCWCASSDGGCMTHRCRLL